VSFGHLEPKNKALQYFRMLGATHPTTTTTTTTTTTRNFPVDVNLQLLFLLSAGPPGSERGRG